MFLLMFNLVIYFILTGLKKNKEDNIYGIQPLLAILAMWLTQDIVLRLFFSKKIIEGKDFLNLKMKWFLRIYQQHAHHLKNLN